MRRESRAFAAERPSARRHEKPPKFIVSVSLYPWLSGSGASKGSRGLARAGFRRQGKGVRLSPGSGRSFRPAGLRGLDRPDHPVEVFHSIWGFKPVVECDANDPATRKLTVFDVV